MTTQRSWVALALLGWLAAGCGGTSVCDQGVSVAIADNHPNGDHELVITADDVAAGVEVTYDITGDNTGHGHSVVVTMEDFAALEDGDVVTIESSDLGAVGQDHTHVVTLTCEPAA